MKLIIVIQEARAALLAELHRLREAPVSEAELARMQEYTVGAHAIAQQNGSAVLAEVVDAWLLGEGLEELEHFERRIRAVTAQEILAYAAEALDPERRAEGLVRGRPSGA